MGARVNAAVTACQQAACGVKGEGAAIGMDGRAVGGIDGCCRIVAQGRYGICRRIDANDRQGIEAAIEAEIIVAHDIDQIRAGWIDGKGDIDRSLAARRDIGDRKRGEGGPASAGIKQARQLARVQIDDTGGNGSARSGCQLDRSRAGVRNRAAGLRGAEYRNPCRAAIGAAINAGLAEIGIAAGGDGGVENIGIRRVPDQRGDRARREAAGGCHLRKSRAVIGAAKQAAGKDRAAGARHPRLKCGGQNCAAARRHIHHALAAQGRAAQTGERRAAIGAVEQARLHAAEILRGREGGNGAETAVRRVAIASDEGFVGWVGRIQRQAGNRQRRFLVGERRPACPGIDRFPDAAIDSAQIQDIGVQRISGDGLHSARCRAVGRIVCAPDGLAISDGRGRTLRVEDRADLHLCRGLQGQAEPDGPRQQRGFGGRLHRAAEVFWHSAPWIAFVAISQFHSARLPALRRSH